MNKKDTKTPKLHVRKGDQVVVTAGAEKGNKGEVLRVIPKTQRAVVSGLNIVTKHVKPTAENPQGGINKVEAPIHVSNLMLLENDEPTRTGRRVNEETGKIERYSKKTGEAI